MFAEIESSLYPVVCRINTYLSNYILVFLLSGVGIWYTFKTRFVQIRCFPEAIKNTFGSLVHFGKRHDSGMSSFQALSTAIASQVGTGNIVGASGAILVGGPGAIFWMWVMAFLGMATIYAEAVLAVKTRKIDTDGHIKGGPVYYITTAFNGIFGKFLAGCFAIAIILALGCMGCMVQSNSISYTMQSAFGIPSWVIGIILIVICSIIFIGGIKRLAFVAEKIVPFMALFFIAGGIIILIARIQYIPDTFMMIFKYAFHPQAIIGGGFWYALMQTVSQGAKRGLFSNEAGMGSTPHAHAMAKVKTPHEQGTIAMMGVFVDTFVILTINALVIISTLYTQDGILNAGYTGAITEVITKTNLVQTAFGTVFGSSVGAIFVAICLMFFAFSTILGWNFFGKINTIYLFGKNKRVKLIYALISLTFIMFGTVVSCDLVWEMADMFNNLMVIPNVIALFALTKMVLMLLRNGKTN